MSWLHTANGGLLRNQKEVIALIILVLNQLLVNDSSWWRVDNLTSIFTEHPLIYSFVDDNQSNLWRIHLIVSVLEYFFELDNLFLQDLLSLLLPCSISVDDELIRKATTVHFKIIESSFQALVQVFFDDLLVLGLKDDVSKMTGEGLVSCCDEANN